MAEQTFYMTEESILRFLQQEKDGGASADTLRQRGRFVRALYDWLPEGKAVTKQALEQWRQTLGEKGYAPETVSNYVKGVNRYLVFAGRPDLRFSRGRRKDIAGLQFGYLTALEPTGEKRRRDILWRCRCKCGAQVILPATRLLTGNTMSCGCLKAEHLRQVNQYINATSLRSAMEERVTSRQAVSGYTGVTTKHGKWHAYIKYQGRHHSLGDYASLEDAVKARAIGKEQVCGAAKKLVPIYEALHKDDPPRPDRTALPDAQPQAVERGTLTLRSDNTSGCTGVSQKNSGWAAKITYQKVTYQLGTYAEKAQAVEMRRRAEAQLKEDPEKFAQWAKALHSRAEKKVV